jgi:hypothetical protein
LIPLVYRMDRLIDSVNLFDNQGIR